MSRKTATAKLQARRTPKRDVDGILLLDKPTGISSNKALQIAKRLLQARKAGHTGSLDPLANGMLPLCFGNATKVSGMLLDADKAYEVRMTVGARTDTADAEGEVVERSATTTLGADALQTAITAYTGEYDQVPPMYSALKKDGKRLYELARAGVEVERKPRRVTIRELRVLDPDPAAPRLFVRCSKGTYIRSLVEDLAAHAGTLAYVTELRRVWAEPFQSLPMVSLEQLEAAAEEGLDTADALLLGADQALLHLPAASFAGPAVAALQNGRVAEPLSPASPGACRMYAESGEFIGIGEADAAGTVAPKRIFAVARQD